MAPGSRGGELPSTSFHAPGLLHKLERVGAKAVARCSRAWSFSAQRARGKDDRDVGSYDGVVEGLIEHFPTDETG